MICPECSKQDTEVISSTLDKGNNSVERKRKCKCGYQFLTYELISPHGLKISGLKTKIRYHKLTRSYWLEWKIGTYGKFLIQDFSKSMVDRTEELEKKHKKKVNLAYVKKINGKIYYSLQVENGKEYKFQYEKKKMEIIKEILANRAYWEHRKTTYKDKPIEDMESPKKVIIEARQYLNSVLTNIKKSEIDKNTGKKKDKYDCDFFLKYSILFKQEFAWIFFKEIR